MAKQRLHREWFRTVSLGGRKSCPSCKKRLGPTESVWSWGEYRYGKWRTVDYFCRECYAEQVKSRLTGHTAECGCQVELVGKGETLPEWLSL